MLKRYRKWQTLILALLTFVLFVWAAIDVFDVAPAAMWQFFVSASLLVGALVLAAACCVGLMVLIKRLKS